MEEKKKEKDRKRALIWEEATEEMSDDVFRGVLPWPADFQFRVSPLHLPLHVSQ